MRLRILTAMMMMKKKKKVCFANCRRLPTAPTQLLLAAVTTRPLGPRQRQVTALLQTTCTGQLSGAKKGPQTPLPVMITSRTFSARFD
jgi:hypothetical protein